MDEENLRPEIEQMQKEGIFFFGLTRKPQETLQAGDVFCLPSYREGFGTSVIEASLLQMPVICSDTYGLAETIVDNETGLRHKVADSEDLYKQMRTLFLDANLRKSIRITSYNVCYTKLLRVESGQRIGSLDARNAFVMTDMMRDVVRFGTAAKARSLGRNDLAGKTRNNFV